MLNGMNSEVNKNILSADLRRNASKLIGRNFIMQKDNHPKHNANTTKVFIREKKWKVLDWPSQSTDCNPIEHAFHLLKRRLKGKNPETTTERGCSKNLKKHYKTRM